MSMSMMLPDGACAPLVRGVRELTSAVFHIAFMASPWARNT
jgi:hypothetical protein